MLKLILVRTLKLQLGFGSFRFTDYAYLLVLYLRLSGIFFMTPH